MTRPPPPHCCQRMTIPRTACRCHCHAVSTILHLLPMLLALRVQFISRRCLSYLLVIVVCRRLPSLFIIVNHRHSLSPIRRLVDLSSQN